MSSLIRLLPALLLAATCTVLPDVAGAMTLKDCSVKYQAAKKDGSLGTHTWAEFRHTDCGDAAAETANASATAAVADTAKPVASATAPVAPAMPAVAPADFPTAIDPRYAAEKPARGRLHTCSDSYRAHKKAGTLNGLKWLQKGGGFYSLCNRKLKGAA